MTYATEFPGFVLDVEIPADWTDQSWHNDACPKFETSTGFYVFVDWSDPADREFVAERFIVQPVDGTEDYFQTNEWSEVLAFVNRYRLISNSVCYDMVAPDDTVLAWLEREPFPSADGSDAWIARDPVTGDTLATDGHQNYAAAKAYMVLCRRSGDTAGIRRV